MQIMLIIRKKAFRCRAPYLSNEAHTHFFFSFLSLSLYKCKMTILLSLSIILHLSNLLFPLFVHFNLPFFLQDYSTYSFSFLKIFNAIQFFLPLSFLYFYLIIFSLIVFLRLKNFFSFFVVLFFLSFF